jgi:two-component system chemotaxis sensor kinase CheA
MKIDLSRFRQAFFQEAAEHVDHMESALLGLNSGKADPEELNAIFRAAHSIKGASGTFGLEHITRFTHTLEEFLDRLRQGQVDPSPDRVDLLLRACDLLRSLLTAAEANGPVPEGMEPILTSLTVAQRAGQYVEEGLHQLRQADRASDPCPQRYRIRFRPSPAIFREGMDPLLVLRELRELGSVESVVADVAEVPTLDQLRPDTCHLAWTIELTTRQRQDDIRDVFAFVEEGAEIAIDPVSPQAGESEAPAAALTPVPSAPATERKRPRDAGSLRVATEKVDQLINLVGELVIAHSMAVEIADHFTPARLADLQGALTEVGRNTRELQERVMAVRMLPVGTAFARLPRIVHDIANSTGKSIRIEMAGEEAELDKTILEGIVDPLTHLVRNAADHGIERADERRAVGKPEQGTVALRARHEGGNFLIDVCDDGRGLSLERIRQKALERGLLTAAESPTDEQLQALIFRPGFSTAETVSEVSGRGVGMDVVRKNIEALGGAVALNSRPGEGTRVSIKLPLTLAILEGQLVRVGSERYVLPLVSILESTRPSPDEVRRIAGQGEVVMVRKNPVPLVRLHELFGIEGGVREPWRALVVILEHDNSRVALLVDELLGQQQVVIKNLQTNFRKVEGTMGATILGDGRVSLIVDAAGLVELSRKRSATPWVRAAS